jgi:hypothetical protein
MKKFKWKHVLSGIILFILAILFSWNLQGDNDPRFLQLVFDSNTEADMSHYEIYWWQGDDTTGVTPANFVFSETINHSFTADSIMSTVYPMTYDYITGGVIAVDSTGLKSTMGIAPRFYTYAEFFAPSSPANIRVIK